MNRLTGVVAWLITVPCTAALAAETAEQGGTLTGNSVLDMFQRGGIFMWPILLCSVVTLAFVLERAVSLRLNVVFPQKFFLRIKALLEAGNLEEALALCSREPSAFATLLSSCLKRADSTGFEMEAGLEEAGGRVIHDLRRNSRPLGVVADVSPLLGLMGTVWGMIKAFEVVAKTGALGRTELLAQGIGEALLTTAFGLLVAIPALIFYQVFRGRADALVRLMEDACIDILETLRKRKKAEHS